MAATRNIMSHARSYYIYAASRQAICLSEPRGCVYLALTGNTNEVYMTLFSFWHLFPAPKMNWFRNGKLGGPITRILTTNVWEWTCYATHILPQTVTTLVSLRRRGAYTSVHLIQNMHLQIATILEYCAMIWES